MSILIYKNDFETVVINYLGDDIGYIVKGKKNYTVNIYGKEYLTKLNNRLKLTEWIEQLVKHFNYEAYSIVQLQKRGFTVKA